MNRSFCVDFPLVKTVGQLVIFGEGALKTVALQLLQPLFYLKDFKPRNTSFCKDYLSIRFQLSLKKGWLVNGIIAVNIISCNFNSNNVFTGYQTFA